MDPVGLTLENFDGAGSYRTTENGAVIDVSGSLDGHEFKAAQGLGQALHDNPLTSVLPGRQDVSLRGGPQHGGCGAELHGGPESRRSPPTVTVCRISCARSQSEKPSMPFPRRPRRTSGVGPRGKPTENRREAMSKLNRRTILRGVVGGAAVSMAPAVPGLFSRIPTARRSPRTGAALAAALRHLDLGLRIHSRALDPDRDGHGLHACRPISSRSRPIARQAGDLQRLRREARRRAEQAARHRLSRPAHRHPGAERERRGADARRADRRCDRRGTRFRSIELSTSGIERSYSFRAGGSPNPSETSPIALYQRIFGEGFQDPNAAKFTPGSAARWCARACSRRVKEDRQNAA